MSRTNTRSWSRVLGATVVASASCGLAGGGVGVISEFAAGSVVLGQVSGSDVRVEPYPVIVTAQRVPIRCGDSTMYYAIAMATAGDGLVVVAETTGWLKVAYPKGMRAFVKVEEAQEAGDRKIKLVRPSRLLAPHFTAGARGSFFQIFEKELPAGTELKLIEMVRDADGKVSAYSVEAPAGAFGYISREAVRRATADEGARVMSGELSPKLLIDGQAAAPAPVGGAVTANASATTAVEPVPQAVELTRQPVVAATEATIGGAGSSTLQLNTPASLPEQVAVTMTPVEPGAAAPVVQAPIVQAPVVQAPVVQTQVVQAPVVQTQAASQVQEVSSVTVYPAVKSEVVGGGAANEAVSVSSVASMLPATGVQVNAPIVINTGLNEVPAATLVGAPATVQAPAVVQAPVVVQAPEVVPVVAPVATSVPAAVVAAVPEVAGAALGSTTASAAGPAVISTTAVNSTAALGAAIPAGDFKDGVPAPVVSSSSPTAAASSGPVVVPTVGGGAGATGIPETVTVYQDSKDEGMVPVQVPNPALAGGNRGTAAATFSVSSAGGLRGTIEQLSAIFNKVRQQPLETAELDQAIAEFQRVQSSLGSSPAEQRLRNQLQGYIDAMDIRRQLRNTQKESASASSFKLLESDLGKRVIELERQRIYTVIGRLVRSTVYDGGRAPVLYRVMSPEPGSARTLGYLVPDDKFDLAEKLEQVVGIIGELRPDESLRTNLIIPTRVDVVSLSPITTSPNFPGLIPAPGSAASQTPAQAPAQTPAPTSGGSGN